MASEPNFDELVKKTMVPEMAKPDFYNLFGHTFALPQWHFIARGEFPDIYPYVASNAAVADGQYMIRAFTDPDRLHHFAKENNLQDAEGNTQLLSIPTNDIITYLESFIEQGVHGIWFNSNSTSEGFFTPLYQLRRIKEHLVETEWKSEGE